MSVQVRKGNKILSIAEDAVDRYINQGYSVIDKTGAVITKAIPVGNNQLRAEYIRMSEEIDNFKAENKSLTEKIEYLEQENAKLAKELLTLKSTPITEKTTTTRRRKQTTSEEEVTE